MIMITFFVCLFCLFQQVDIGEEMLKASASVRTASSKCKERMKEKTSTPRFFVCVHA